MIRIPVAATLVCLVLAVPACTRTSAGSPSAGDEPQSQVQATTSQEAPQKTRGPSGDDPMPGIVPTPAPAGAPCVPDIVPPVRVVARVDDPGAPTVTVGLPDGWSSSSGNGDPEGVRLEGPDGMEAVVTIAATSLDAEAAFRDWIDFLTEDADISTVSTLPGQLCGYSGQELIGTLADDAQSVEYRDRLVYIGTAGQAYLVVVHAEAPAGTPGFDEAAMLLTEDFEIGLV